VRLFLDENIPPVVARRLLTLFPGSIHALSDDRFRGYKNGSIYKFLVAHPTHLMVTLDLHFANRLRYPPGPTGGIVVIRMKGMTVSTAYRRLLMILSSRTTLKGRLSILSRRKVRTPEP
jgi:hypothetical protein